MIPKERLHQLVEELGERTVPAAERYLERLKASEADPVLHALLTAPLDDEPDSADERAAVAVGKKALEQGEVVTTEDVRREFGW